MRHVADSLLVFGVCVLLCVRSTKQLEQLAELKRRLAAVERTKGALSVDLSKVNLRYRWKAGPFGGCQAPCGPSTRTRKVQCLSFSGKPVKHTFCEGQKKPKATVKCQKKLCPIDCVMGEWKPRGKCRSVRFGFTFRCAVCCQCLCLRFLCVY